MIIQVARGGAVDRQFRDSPPPGDVIVEAIPADAEGNLDPPDVGEVVLSVPSPQSLAREPDTVRRAIRLAGSGPEPLVLIVEAAEELCDEELEPVAQTREIGGFIIGRRLYETLLVWETDPALREDALGAAFADAYCAIPKVVFSRTLDSVPGNARLAEALVAEEVAAAFERPTRTS